MTQSPTDVFRHALDLLLAKDMTGFVGLFAEDAVMEFPFAEPPSPRRLDGREALAAYLDGYPERLAIGGFPRVVLHQTTDPTVVIVEFTAEGAVVSTGRPYEMSYVAVVTVHDGQIVSYRDYWSPAAGARALSGQ